MEKEIRIQEILSSIKTFGKDMYSSMELLREYSDLEKELVKLTFSEKHSAFGKLKLSDVEKHLDDMNDECGHSADDETERFRNSCSWLRDLTETVRKEKTSESLKALNNLYMLRVKKQILKELKIRSEDRLTEIDAVVFTEKAVFMIELIQNGSKVTIDENGSIDSNKCNIAEIMREKEQILRDVLSRSDCSYFNIVTLAVFANSRSKVCCNCDEINYSFITNLKYTIEKYSGCPVYNGKMISDMAETVLSASETVQYSVKDEISLLKQNFAETMAVLEKASEKRAEAVDTAENTAEEAEDLLNEEVSDVRKADRKKYTAPGIRKNVRPAHHSGAGVTVKKRKRSALIWAAELAAVIGTGIVISKMIRSSGR